MGVNLSELSSFDLDKVNNEIEQKSLTYDDSIGTDIAIIGISANLPEANDVSEYWNNLRDGKDNIIEFPEARQVDIEKYLNSLGSDTGDVEFFQAAFLNEIDKFDYRFFRLTPSEASLMSPVQRLFLETTYKTIEDAGYGGSKIIGSKTGVFVGCIGDAEEDTYADILSQSDSAQNPSAFTGNLTSMIPSRISYFLDLKGPSMVVDTACSSSLVAIHLACQAIRNGECDMALAGGIKLFLVPVKNRIKLAINSSNYRSKAFDDSSDGIGVGEGSAAVMLKPLSKALRDRDNIYAVIKGSAINQDGNSIGITAPNVAEQANVIAKAWKNARINPETISYIEAHGTGTNIGDPIEIEGIKRAFSRFTKKKQFCAIGSVKTNIGHLNEAAGIAGLIKLVLCLKYGEIPPSIHFNLPNRKIDFEESPVYVNDRLAKWDANGELRRGGISSFGFSGTNCHVVLEEAPAIRHANEVKSSGLFAMTISAKSEGALDKLLAAYNSFLDKNPNIDIRDLCYTASLGREHHNHRVAIIAQDLLSLKESISELCSNGVSKSNYGNVFFNTFKVIRGVRSTESDVGLTEEKLEGMNRLAHFKLEEFVRTNKSDKALLSEICSLYSSGADIDWSFLYEKERPRTISLPTYVFDKERCWCEIQEVAAQNGKYDSQKSFYNIVWKQKPLLNEEKGDAPQTIVILRSSENSYTNFEDKLRNSSARIVSVTLGDSFKQINNNKYITDISENSFNLLFDKIKESKSIQIVHLLAAEINEGAKTTDELQRNLEHGLYSLFYIAKAFKGYESIDSTSILIAAGNINKIVDNDNIIIPENATISGLAKVINREFTNISCRLIDIDAGFSEDDLVGELHLRSGEQQVAYRKGNRYAESFTQFDTENSGNSEVKVRENGVYLITGGIRGIGYEVAKYLVNEAKVNIILVNRSKIPQRDTWDTISANNENKKLLEKISAIKSLEKTGSTVEYYSADVSDEIHVRNLLNSIKEKYGNIHGIIHSAGVTDDRLINEKNKEDFDAIIRPKVYGTWLLNHFTNAENLDFFIMFSSVSSILAAPGQSDYSAANAYLDSFSDYRRVNGKKATTINWVAWKEIGMAVEKGFTADTTFKAITTKKAMDCFDKVFHKDISRVLIGELNFESNMAALLEKAPFDLSDDIKHKLKESAKQRAFLKEQKVSNNRPNVRLKGKEPNQYSKIEQQIAEVCMSILGFKEIDIYDNFFDLGADSIALSHMFKELDKHFPNVLSLTKVFAYPSISALAKYLSEQLGESADSEGSHDNLMLEQESEFNENDSIAIIGIGSYLPTGYNLDEFWNSIRNGKDLISNIPEARKKDVEKYLSFKGEDTRNLKFLEAAYLEEIDGFDYKFFKLSPKEASLMDPNQRKFLETAWAAIEDGGYGGNKLKGTKTGVFVGFSNNPLNNYLDIISDVEPGELPVSLTGNLTSIIPSRISYLLDLKGPSMLIDTACSSSLTAVHTACRSLKSGECDTAIAGGVKINIMPLDNEIKIGIESSTGRTRAFDDDSDGTGIGEGVISFLLKPLKRAIEDKDNIYATIKGSAVNQDGTSVGITAPNVNAQTDVILEAWKDSKIDPGTLSYIEAHGTGTKLGDPIEIEGLNEAFKKHTKKRNFCAISTVKSNMGHLYEASGMAGLLKAVLSLKHKELAPSIHFVKPNDKIDFIDTALYVNDRLTKWDASTTTRRCGVSSFGFSGTNCHVVLEEAPEIKYESISGDSRAEILGLTAKSEAALHELVRRYKTSLENSEQICLKDICSTANTGRTHHNFRLAIVAKDKNELLRKLNFILENKFSGLDRKIGFYGKHFVIMSDKEFLQQGELRQKEKFELTTQAGLLTEELAEQNIFDNSLLERLCELYVKGADVDWDILYGGNRAGKKVSLPSYPFEKHRCWINIDSAEKRNISDNIRVIHPLLEKQMVESVDQIIFSTEFSPKKHFVLSDHIIMGSYVIPGTTYIEMIYQAGRRLSDDGQIQINDITFYTPVVLSESDTREVQTIVKFKDRSFEFTIVSNTADSNNGTLKKWIKHAEGKFSFHEDSSFTCHDINQIKERCSSDILDIKQNELTKGFIEFGPRWLNIHKLWVGSETALAELSLPDEFVHDLETYYIHPCMLDMAAAAFCFTFEKRYLPLSYKRLKVYGKMPHKFYSYIKSINTGANEEVVSFDIDLIDADGKVFIEITEFSLKKVHEFKTLVRDNIFTYSKWIPADTSSSDAVLNKGLTVVFRDTDGVGKKITEEIKAIGVDILEVVPGPAYEKLSDRMYKIGGAKEDYDELIKDLKDKKLSGILHMLTADDNNSTSSCEATDKNLSKGLYSLFYLTQSMVKYGLKDNLELIVISKNANEITGEEISINPENAALFGLSKVISKEHQGIRCKFVDIDSKSGYETIIREAVLNKDPENIAFRNNSKYLNRIERMNIEEVPDNVTDIREHGVYLITGGSGGLGLEFAKHIAAKGKKVKIALLGRSVFPLREEWENILENGCDSKTERLIRTILDIESQGSKVIYCSADISIYAQAEKALNDIRKEFGPINGIIHAAGVAGSGFVFMKQEGELQKVIGPKIHGTVNLDGLSREDKLDFMILFSSIASFLAYPGQGDYTAASLFLNSYAAYRNRLGKKTISINWPAWKETGMAVDHGVNTDTAFKAISTTEALYAFDEVINKKLSEIIIGELDSDYFTKFGESSVLANNLMSAITRKKKHNAPKEIEKNKSLSVQIKDKNVEELDDIEVLLSGIWGKVLGMNEIDIYESFYEMGGDSILATQMFKEIDKEFPGVIDIADIFSYSSVSQLATYIKGKTGSKRIDNADGNENVNSTETEESDIEDILDKLVKGEISMSEADEVIKTGGKA